MPNNVVSYNGAISNRDGVIPGREKVRCGPIQTMIQQPHQICKICKLRVSLWNIGTMCGRASEAVETIGHWQSHWKGCSARLISAKGFKYTFIWSEDNPGFGGVGVLLNEN